MSPVHLLILAVLAILLWKHLSSSEDFYGGRFYENRLYGGRRYPYRHRLRPWYYPYYYGFTNYYYPQYYW